MSNEIKIHAALAKLEAGKFSFQMVDAIKNHISEVETELEVARTLHASAIRELRLQEYANWRLEGELRKLNAKIYALLKANMLTEKACKEMKPLAIKCEELFKVSRKFAGAAVEEATAYLKAGKLQSQLGDATAWVYAFLKANTPTQKDSRDMKPYAIKVGEYFEALKKHIGSSLERATTYLSTLNKSAP
jgi:hypothetical protein